VRLRLIRASFSRRRARLFLAMAAVTMGVGVAITLGTLALRVGDDLARDLRGSGPNFALLPAGATWVPDLGGADYRPARAGGVLDESAVAAMKKTFWKNNILEAAPELVAGARAGEATFHITGTWFEHAVATEDGQGAARGRDHRHRRPEFQRTGHRRASALRAGGNAGR
jgi:putative ABC transport system permease protein